ncbi:MAG TPA: glycogen debranching protein GlgX [Acidobacteriota bacterium]|nr:glycogen debranching protein GlgX [Acidobacteriota bacterium]
MGELLKSRTTRKISPGSDFPLGATPTSDGVNFALFSRNAQEVYLQLYDDPSRDPSDVIKVENQRRFVWSVFVHGIKAGQLYGYRVRGDFNPARGLRFNEHKLLMDPYAKALTGKAVNTDNLLLAYDSGSPDRDRSLDTRASDRIVPKSIVVDDAFDWKGDASPDIPLERLVIYEVHLKGFTAHPSSKVSNPGTYLGFVQKIPYLQRLGINAVEILPIHEFYVDDFLKSKGLTNYWGYNTLGFFSPESSYSTGSRPGCQVEEFKTMVRELHRAGIEVILDVVYNHTAEGSELGPTLSFRGIDNPTYYCLTGTPNEPYRYYMNWTGCGNSLNLSNPHVIRLVMDSLRYWVEVMHVDGFRFDLASVLGREDGLFRVSAPFFDVVSQDPILNRVKLIAEPWDLGTYQVGNFPVDWSEWNGRFRDTVRKFVKGDAGQVRELASRLTGSSDLYADDGRSAYNSVNFVTCHDGFTLRDLVSYNQKHNDANMEGNRDGADDNNSWNCGIEGETDDPAVNRLRRQVAKNHLCLLLFAAGTPMVLGGDEFLRTQSGNNNAYCQDNQLSWFDSEEIKLHSEMVEFFRKAVALTRRCTILQRRKFFLGQDLDADNIPDVAWFGANLRRPDWEDPDLRTLCYQLDGGEEPSALGKYFLFVILNADFRALPVQLPVLSKGKWRRVIDTSLPAGEDFCEEGQEVPLNPADCYLTNPRSTVVLLGL